ncbi:arylsulfatase [Algivirga pacifica]|uniref:Arylsulfatase n=1 Tax=Algivirga pacifica TaxID=1162670 RepID=A0ABP9DB88_9BACT
MKYIYFLGIIGVLWCSSCSEKRKYPNVILILADDLGYGDISAYQPQSALKTPVLDSLAKSGLSFTNAHAASAVCTPSRYSLLTGEYSWRSKLKSGVLFGYDQPLITPEKMTIPKMLKQLGYQTGMIGKWHLGLPWQLKEDSDYKERTKEKIYFQVLAKENDVVLDAPFTDTLWHQKIGFDYFYGISASLDMPPYGFVENGHYTGSLTATLQAKKDTTLTQNTFWRSGPATPDFEPEEVLGQLLEQSTAFIERNQDGPFFLYVPLTAPHTPWLPTKDFQGKSGVGTYGDFVQMVDWSVGEITAKLKALDLQEETIIIFSSDNGAPLKGIDSYGGEGHAANAGWRGQKGDLYEGGHRVPLIMTWGNQLPARQSGELVMLNDVMRTLADLLNISLQKGEGVDSHSFAGVVSGEENWQGRTEAVYHSQVGTFALQHGNWKWIEHLGSGGFSKPRIVEPEGVETGQLYNLQEDTLEQNNRMLQEKERAMYLQQRLKEMKSF